MSLPNWNARSSHTVYDNGEHEWELFNLGRRRFPTNMPQIDIPGPVRQVYAHMHVLDGRSHIAGGAVRDTLLGRPVKDWDLFIPAALNINDVIDVARNKGGYLQTIEQGPQYFQWTDRVVALAEFTFGPHLLNVIQLQNAHADMFDNVERFDWGLCKVAVEPDGDVYTGIGWDEDVQDQVFTLRNLEDSRAQGEETQFAYAMRRFNRLRLKYKGWGLHIPARYGKHVQNLVHLKDEHEFVAEF